MTRRFGIVLSAIALLFVMVLLAQRPSSALGGLIRNTDGALIPGVAVELYDNNGKIVAVTQSDHQGHYQFRDLPPGNYELRASGPGFQILTLQIALRQGRTETVHVSLQAVGTSAAVVEVQNNPGTHTFHGVQGGVAGGVPGGSMGGVLGGIVGGVPSAAPPPPPPGEWPRSVVAQRMRLGPVEERENYGHFVENGFQSPITDALSTFSIDVDTASYANMRRFLHDGNTPPKDAIRLEEWVNYFQYRYPEPTGAHPVSITTELAMCPWQPQHKLARIGVKAKSIDVSKLPPANLVFLVDVSGSMTSQDKLPLLQRAFSLLTEQLRPQDEVSIVVYAGAAGMVLPPTSGRERMKILSALNELHAGGSTAGAQGIQLAYRTARANFKSGGNNRVILATDGDFNVGLSTEAELIQLIEKQRKGGIFLTVLGFGTGNLQDVKMKALSRHGNGNYAYVDSLLEARKVLVQEMGANLLTLAKDVKIQVEFNPAKVQAYRLIGYENRLLRPEDFNDDRKDAGEMGAGHTVTALYEIVPPGVKGTIPSVDKLRYQKTDATPAAESDEVLTVKLRYKQPMGDTSQLLSVPLQDAKVAMRDASEDMRFATAVASFAQILRGSAYKGRATLDQVIDFASGSLGTDPNGHRAEFLYLVKTAKGLSPSE